MQRNFEPMRKQMEAGLSTVPLRPFLLLKQKACNFL